MKFGLKCSNLHFKKNKTIKFEPTWDWLEPSLESLQRIHVNKEIILYNQPFHRKNKWNGLSIFTTLIYKVTNFIKYKDEYQKSKWTIECRIFISFIWSRSELWKCYNNNVFTKKRIFATYIGMSRFPQPYQNSSPSGR